jgi:hypothetical protein
VALPPPGRLVAGGGAELAESQAAELAARLTRADAELQAAAIVDGLLAAATAAAMAHAMAVATESANNTTASSQCGGLQPAADDSISKVGNTTCSGVSGVDSSHASRPAGTGTTAALWAAANPLQAQLLQCSSSSTVTNNMNDSGGEGCSTNSSDHSDSIPRKCAYPVAALYYHPSAAATLADVYASGRALLASVVPPAPEPRRGAWVQVVYHVESNAPTCACLCFPTSRRNASPPTRARTTLLLCDVYCCCRCCYCCCCCC